jgi:hypothetical protein
MKLPSSTHALALALPCLLAACATQQQNASLQCGGGGLAAGYVLCKLAGGSDKSCMGVGIAAGTIGAAACYSYAGRLEKRRQELAGRENDLNARIRYAKGLNEDGEKLNAELRQRVTVASQRVDELNRQGARAAGQLTTERTRLDDELKVARQQVSLQRQAFNEVKNYQSRRSTPSKDLDVELSRQEQLLARTQQQVDELASVRQRV